MISIGTLRQDYGQKFLLYRYMQVCIPIAYKGVAGRYSRYGTCRRVDGCRS